MNDFQFGGNTSNLNTGADNIIGGANVPSSITYTPALGVSPGIGMSSFGTTGDVVTLNSIDPSGTIYSEVSTWIGTVVGGPSAPLGIIAGNSLTSSTSGNVITLNGINPSGTIYAEVSNWGGTYAQSSVLDELVNLTYEVSEPQGFVNRTDSSLSFIGTTFSITGNHSVYCGGTRFNKTGTSINVTPAYGMHFIKYDHGGSLNLSQVPWDLMLDTPIAGVFYSIGGTAALLLEERHGVVMDGMTHQYLHTTRGAQFKSGFSVGGYVPASSTLADVQYSVEDGEFYDEDILNTVTGITDGGPYPILYRTGADGEWTWRVESTLPILRQGIPIAYNNFTGGSWALTAMTVNNSYINYYIFATNCLTSGFGVVIVPGQTPYLTLATARAESVSSLQVGTFPFVECVPVAKVLYQYSSAFGDPIGDARIVEITRIVDQTFNVTTAASNHNSLAGLQGGTAGEYFHLTETEYLGYQPANTIYSNISTWGGTLAKSGTTPDYATISTWMGTAGGGASPRTLIATGTANNSASIEFTNAEIENYRRLYLTGEGITPQTADQVLFATTSSNVGGTYWGAAQYESNGFNLGSAFLVSRYNTGWALVNAPYHNVNTYGGCFETIINRVAVGTASPSMLSHGMSPINGYAMDSHTAGYMLPKVSINAIKIAYASGNINQNIFKLYGEI